jgi:hypothetical protein
MRAEMPLHPCLILSAMMNAQLISGQMHRRHQGEDLPFGGFQEGMDSPELYLAQPESRSHMQPRNVAH